MGEGAQQPRNWRLPPQRSSRQAFSQERMRASRGLANGWLKDYVQHLGRGGSRGAAIGYVC